MDHETILLADDEDTLRVTLARRCREEGFEVIACRDGAEALRTLQTETVDGVITDLRMPGVAGLELIEHARRLAPGAPVIVVTAFGEVDTAVAAMQRGASDYICKPLNFDELVLKLRRLLDHGDLVRQNRFLREQIRQVHQGSEIIAASSAMAAILAQVRQLARTPANVVISGESGTGKEVLARAVHYGGPTQEGPFVAVNCGGLVDSLIESEFFGHRRGAFTGADSDRIGYFEAAHNGTLFLDEITSLPLKNQSVVLRAIEERVVTRVGETRPRKVNIRIVAATNHDLETEVQAGRLREDLYYRLNVVRIHIPPLRERPDDVPALIEHFVKKYNAELNRCCPGFSAEAVEAMRRHPWHGNVRELENAVERALIFAEDRMVEPRDLALRHDRGAAAAAPTDLRGAVRSFERQHILDVLSAVDRNKAAAANVLGIGLSSLYRKMEELGIPVHGG